MKKSIKTAMVGSVVLGAQISMAESKLIAVKELSTIGIDPVTVADRFLSQSGIQINLNEPISVSGENEGKNLRFETLDRISIIVPIESARGPENKIDVLK